MKLQDILDQWKEDSKIDLTRLSEEAANVYQLHHKYIDYWTTERKVLKSTRLELKRLELEKYEFFLQGPSKETQAKGWVYPVSGKVLKNDVKTYADADKEIQELEFRIESIQAKVDCLVSIVDMIRYRSQNIGNMMKREQFMGGG